MSEHPAETLRKAARRIGAKPWRVVEAQHRASTMRLVDTLAEQRALEDLLEAGKPPLPAEAAQLHYLLAQIEDRRADLEQRRLDVLAALDELDDLERRCREDLQRLSG